LGLTVEQLLRLDQENADRGGITVGDTSSVPMTADPASPRERGVSAEDLIRRAYRDEPGLVESGAYGLAVETPARAAGMLAGAAAAPVRAYEWMSGDTVESIPPEVMEPMQDATRSGMERLTGLRRPQGDQGMMAMEGGAGLGFTAPFLAGMSIPAGIATAAAGIGLPALGEKFRQDSVSAGQGPFAEAAATMAPEIMGMAGPGLLARIPQAGVALRNGVKALRLTTDAKEFMGQLGISKGQLKHGAAWFKRLIPEHPEDANRYVDEWIQHLDDAILSIEAGEYPTTGGAIQAYDDIGEAMAGVERMIAGMNNTQWGRKYAGQKKATLEAINARYQQLIPDQPIEETVGAYRAYRGQRWDQQRANWTQEMKDAMPPVDVRAEKWAAKKALGMSENPAYIAPEVKLMSQWPDKVPFETWQNMKRDVGRRLRNTSDALHDTAERARRDSLTLPELQEAMSDTLGRLKEGARGKKYEKALRETARYYEDFDPSRKFIRTMGKHGDENFSDPQKLLSGILGADSPADEANYAYNLLSQTPDGVKGLQGEMMRHVLGTTLKEEITVTGMAAIDQRRIKLDGVLQNLLEPEQLEMLDNLTYRMQWIANRSGTAAAPYGTGSAVPAFLQTLFAGPEGSRGVTAILGKQALRMVEAAFGSTNGQVLQRILVEGILDPKVGKVLISLPVEAMPDAWLVNWNKLVKQAATRGGARGYAAFDTTADEMEYAKSSLSRLRGVELDSVTDAEAIKFVKDMRSTKPNRSIERTQGTGLE